jgi:hypothetical protein
MKSMKEPSTFVLRPSSKRGLLATALSGVVVLIFACDSPAPTGLPETFGVSSTALVVTGFSGIDVGAGPGDDRDNSDAAAANFDAAASAIGPLVIEDFEGFAEEIFTSKILTEMTVTFSGVTGGLSGIRGETADPQIRGYNTTDGGARHLRMASDDPGGSGTASVTFTPDEPIEAWGAYFTGVGTVGNTSVEIVFADGSEQTVPVTGAATGGVGFFGFTDPGKFIEIVTVEQTFDDAAGDFLDFIGIDDIRFVPVRTVTEINVAAGGTAQHQVSGKTVLAVEVPPGAFDGVDDVRITLELIDPGASGCHQFLISQVGQCISIEVEDAAEDTAVVANTPLLRGLCLPAGVEDDDDLLQIFKFEESTENVMPQKNIAAPASLDCTGFVPPPVALATGNGLMRFARRIVDGVGQVFAPQPLAAAASYFGDRGRGWEEEEEGGSFYVWANPMVVKAGDVLAPHNVSPINCSNDRGVISIAVLSTTVGGVFDATDIDASNVRFGPPIEGGANLNHLMAKEIHRDGNNEGAARRHEVDVNDDGDLDMVFHFLFGETGLTCDDEYAMLGVFADPESDVQIYQSANFLIMSEGKR